MDTSVYLLNYQRTSTSTPTVSISEIGYDDDKDGRYEKMSVHFSVTSDESITSVKVMYFPNVTLLVWFSIH